jgi:hypothetical protein
MQVGKSKKLCGLTAALMLSVSFAAIERAEADCTPQTSTTTPVNNTTVTCSGPMATPQNPPNGWGNGVETGDTINVQTGATVTGTVAGISLRDWTVNSTGLISGGQFAIVANNGDITVNNGNAWPDE